MVAHLREYFASLTADADDEALIARIRREMERASGYGFEAPRAWCQFINLSMALGEGFDTELPWARELLADKDVEPARRIDALNAACIEHLLTQEDEKAHRPPESS